MQRIWKEYNSCNVVWLLSSNCTSCSSTLQRAEKQYQYLNTQQSRHFLMTVKICKFTNMVQYIKVHDYRKIVKHTHKSSKSVKKQSIMCKHLTHALQCTKARGPMACKLSTSEAHKWPTLQVHTHICSICSNSHVILERKGHRQSLKGNQRLFLFVNEWNQSKEIMVTIHSQEMQFMLCHAHLKMHPNKISQACISKHAV